MDEGREGRVLSSDITPVFKFVLPAAIVIAFVGLSAAALSESDGIGSLLLALCVGALLAFILYEYLLPLKRVAAMAHGLNISNYRTSISVSYSEIAAVARAYKRWDIV